ncbi:MAG: radical SAM protein [Candidatus Omnitrophota bacterium]
MHTLAVRTVFIYMTEHCPLACRYCYFRHKQNRHLLRDVMERFLGFLKRESGAPASFVISGGEALLCWDKVKELVAVLRQDFPVSALHVQTNGLLLDGVKARWLKARGVSLEFGLDGDFETTARWRTPMDRRGFDRLVRNIRRAVAAGVSCGCTMTVHPDEVAGMAGNLRFIKSTGVSSADITPAAFMPWGQKSVRSFKVEYLKILQNKDLRDIIFTGEDHEFIRPGVVDLSLHPSGEVLLGDAFLCLPEAVRRKFSLWDCRTGKLRPEIVEYYQRLYAGLWRRPTWKTYRDYVSFSFEVVNQMMGRDYLNVREMVPLMRFLTRMHLSSRHANPSA